MSSPLSKWSFFIRCLNSVRKKERVISVCGYATDLYIFFLLSGRRMDGLFGRWKRPPGYAYQLAPETLINFFFLLRLWWQKMSRLMIMMTMVRRYITCWLYIVENDFFGWEKSLQSEIYKWLWFFCFLLFSRCSSWLGLDFYFEIGIGRVKLYFFKSWSAWWRTGGRWLMGEMTITHL